jgi:peptidoglycan/LPS O-acetylase OafA/YrhL
MAGPRPSSVDLPAGSHSWSAQEKVIYEETSEDGMSEVTLQENQTTKRHTIYKVRKLLVRICLALLPSPISKLCGAHVETVRPHSTTAYLDGMRGLASFIVLTEHLTMRYHPHVFEEYGNKPTFFQLPIIRLLYSGSVMVAIFFVISGFALSLKPLEIIHERDWERLHHTMASATFRRGIRIFLPPIIVSFIVMIGVRFHLYDQQYSGATDMSLGYPHYMPTIWSQLIDWLEYVLGKLIYPYQWLTPLPNITQSDYAAPLYTIPQEFWSSLFLFAIITGLSRVRMSVRFMVVGFLIFISAWCMRREISMFLAGMILAELHLCRQPSASKSFVPSRLRRLVSEVAWFLVFVIGLYMSSIPHTRGSYGSSTPGFRTISKIIPWNSNVYSIGAVLIVWGITNITLLQRLFTMSVFHYLGQISFALYLVHWPILAGGGWALVPAIWKITGNSTDTRYEVGFGLGFLVLVPVVLWAADLYWRFVDVPCIRFARRFEAELATEKYM